MKDDNLIEIGIQEAGRILCKVIDDFPEMDEEDIRLETTMLALFVYTCEYLYRTGYTEKDLVVEVFDHCEIARKEMDNE